MSFLLEASQNTADFMQSYLLPFGDATKVKRDVVLGELLKPHAADDTVKILLKVTLPAIAKVCLHLITDPILYFLLFQSSTIPVISTEMEAAGAVMPLTATSYRRGRRKYFMSVNAT